MQRAERAARRFWWAAGIAATLLLLASVAVVGGEAGLESLLVHAAWVPLVALAAVAAWVWITS